MKVVTIDSFKGSLYSIEAGNAVKEAVLSLDKTAEVVVHSLADGYGKAGFQVGFKKIEKSLVF